MCLSHICNGSPSQTSWSQITRFMREQALTARFPMEDKWHSMYTHHIYMWSFFPFLGQKYWYCSTLMLTTASLFLCDLVDDFFFALLYQIFNKFYSHLPIVLHACTSLSSLCLSFIIMKLWAPLACWRHQHVHDLALCSFYFKMKKPKTT